MNKMCIECGLIKEMPVDFDIDDHDMTGYTAKCKECLGTLPVLADTPKPKRVYKKRSKPSKKANMIEEPVEVPVMTPDEVESVAVPVVVPADENIDGD